MAKNYFAKGEEQEDSKFTPGNIVNYVRDHPGSNAGIAERISRTCKDREVETILEHLAINGLSHEPLYRKLIDTHI